MYHNRQVDRDYYTSFALEARILHRYSLGKRNAVLSCGVRYSDELTKRKQKGIGTNGSDFDLSASFYGVDLRFRTHNYALFAENIFYLNKKFSVTPGVRYEIINSRLSGMMNNATDAVGYSGNRHFPLFGMGLQYAVDRNTQLYGNISQAYRPYLYSTITPADRVDKIDPGLKDSKGYDIDFGYRGSYQNILQFDVNLFYLFYGNRVGLQTKLDASNNPYLFTTNIGDAVSKGVEAFAELSLSKLLGHNRSYNDLRLFNSFSYTHARYTKGIITKGGMNVDVIGNHVENTPEVMNKTGLQYKLGHFSATIQYSYTGSNYNDAINTVSSSNGVTGLVPAYHLWDLTANWQFMKTYLLSAGINNLSNEKYFNRRITMYPGPGILPADGRSFYVSLSIKI
jgi:Fe(3+) dicitrate transport protein